MKFHCEIWSSGCGIKINIVVQPPCGCFLFFTLICLQETNPLSEVEIASETVAAALGHEMHLAGGGSGAGTEEDNPHTHAHAHAHGQ